ncbi:hypothetical protein [uncultured Oscillibacter sp.]|uniref:hypothetical protein n=1 Tax=uncultured Oscillibacter sp. TaxID=876091 RepID=UPI0025F09FC0|nr:hypothetical protein [uncultured Oscillibacter sp.]
MEYLYHTQNQGRFLSEFVDGPGKYKKIAKARGSGLENPDSGIFLRLFPGGPCLAGGFRGMIPKQSGF